ncbi:MAG: Type II secretory pathway pseudopilin PulG-like protein, partial [Candidatus Woesebacteria bacterium GW2011_GWB1_40_12]
MGSDFRSNIKNLSLGFTLVELLVVIAILGILATIGLVTFSSSQMRGRDAQRKSDLKQISSALEIYYNDYG